MESKQGTSNLLRVMIISSSQAAGEEFAKWLSESEAKEGVYEKTHDDHTFKFYIRWPDCPKGLPGAPAIDAMIIRVKDSEDLTKVSDYVREKGLIQFKILISDEEIHTLTSETKPNMTCRFSQINKTQLLGKIINAETELNNLLLSIFKNFDKSGDGYINFNEMETICKELGIDVTHSDFVETLNSVDKDHDEKISFEEFSAWYKNGRQCSKLMENLILMRIATNSFLNSFVNSLNLQFMKEKLENLNKEKRELVSSFFSLNLEKVKQDPEILISFDGHFGGEFKETVSKSYVQNFEEGLKSTDVFFVVEFQIKDPSKMESTIKFLNNVINLTQDSFINISRKLFSFMNNEMSIKVLRKSDTVICLSFKLKKIVKVEITDFESALQGFLDEEITQKLSCSFCLSGDFEKVKSNPGSHFLDSFQPASCLELKAEILKKNFKLLLKSFKPMPKFLKMWAYSFSGSHIDLNFNLEHLKAMENSFLQQQNQVILFFLKTRIKEILQEVLTSFGGFNIYKKFYESVEKNFSLVFNTPQIHAVAKVDLSGTEILFN
jgi:Ca2+-binding EF-hand superfamily protein